MSNHASITAMPIADAFPDEKITLKMRTIKSKRKKGITSEKSVHTVLSNGFFMSVRLTRRILADRLITVY